MSSSTWVTKVKTPYSNPSLQLTVLRELGEVLHALDVIGVCRRDAEGDRVNRRERIEQMCISVRV
jgi:hypothetical protein